MKNLLIGQRVFQSDTPGTIIDVSDDSRYILIRWDNMPSDTAPKVYPFPNAFLTQKYHLYPLPNSRHLQEVLQPYRSQVCSFCHTYSPRGRTIHRYYVCPDCAPKYDWCLACRRLSNDIRIGLNGEQVCKQCFDRKYPSIHVDLSPSGNPAPTLHIYERLPHQCTNKHKMYCVTAKVATLRNGLYKSVLINLHFCQECNKYYILHKTFDSYTRLHGYICLPRTYPDKKTSSGDALNFLPDTILSQWGYRISLSDQERRQILVHLIKHGYTSKSIISAILHAFSMRHWAPHAASIWLDDLYFVEEYDIEKQPLVDFTRP